jgi:hypothetical protein
VDHDQRSVRDRLQPDYGLNHHGSGPSQISDDEQRREIIDLTGTRVPLRQSKLAGTPQFRTPWLSLPLVPRFRAHVGARTRQQRLQLPSSHFLRLFKSQMPHAESPFYLKSFVSQRTSASQLAISASRRVALPVADSRQQPHHCRNPSFRVHSSPSLSYRITLHCVSSISSLHLSILRFLTTFLSNHQPWLHRSFPFRRVPC